MAVSPRKRRWFNTTLFYVKDSPMKFFLEGYDECRFYEICRIIEAYGGKLTDPRCDDSSIVFSEPERYEKSSRRQYHIKCLHDSIVKNCLQDINKYILPLKWDETDDGKKGKMEKLDEMWDKEKAETDKCNRNENHRPKDTTVDSSSKGVQDTLLKEPLVVVHRMSFADILKNRQRDSELRQRDEESSGVSSCDKTPPLLTRAKKIVKTSPAAPTSPSKFHVNRSLPPLQPTTFAPALDTHEEEELNNAVEFLGVVEKKEIIVDILEISDSEESSWPVAQGSKVAERSAEPVDPPVDDAMDTQYTAFMQHYAVWSGAGPPPRPYVDCDDEPQRDKVNRTRIKREDDWDVSRTRGFTKRTSHDDPESNRVTTKRHRSHAGDCDGKPRGKSKKRNVYSKEENQLIIDYLVKKKAISEGFGDTIWINMGKEKILQNPKREWDSLQWHFATYLRLHYDEYTKDPKAIAEFERLNRGI